jgi:hypothetical protein
VKKARDITWPDATPQSHPPCGPTRGSRVQRLPLGPTGGAIASVAALPERERSRWRPRGSHELTWHEPKDVDLLSGPPDFAFDDGDVPF